MTTEEAKRRIERLESYVDEIHERRWSEAWPEGHSERETHKPKWLRNRSAVAGARPSAGFRMLDGGAHCMDGGTGCGAGFGVQSESLEVRRWDNAQEQHGDPVRQGAEGTREGSGALPKPRMSEAEKLICERGATMGGPS